MRNHRLERLAGLIKKEVSYIFKKDVQDPRIGFVSITRVKVSPDIKQVNIHVSIYGDEDLKMKTMQGLRRAAGFIRSKLGDNLEMKDVPELLFYQDDSIEKAARVFGIMNQLKKEKKNNAG